MYTLYYSPGTASMCVHWMLIELGEPHELVKVDIEAGEHRKPEYLKLNPSGVVPTPSMEAPASARASSDARTVCISSAGWTAQVVTWTAPGETPAFLRQTPMRIAHWLPNTG